MKHTARVKPVILRLYIIIGLLSPIHIAMSADEDAEKLPKVIAHRGASYLAPENTRAAIQLAIEKKTGIIEFDVMETSDGKLYLFHDRELKRLTGKEGTFAELNAKQAAQLDVGSWFKKGEKTYNNEQPPTLKQAIKQCLEGGCIPLIEHKTGQPENYAQVLRELDAVDKVIVQSFNWAFIRDLRKLLPNLTIGALGSKSLAKHKESLAELKPDWVGWKYKDIKATDIKWLKDQKIKIATWTVNDSATAQQLINMGVDRIITDRPAYIANAVGGQ